MSIVVAMCQIEVLAGDVAGNVARIDAATAEARAQGAQLACFPETALYGWVNPEAHVRADTIPGRDADALCAIARKHGLYLCVGLCEKVGDDLYDSAILIDDKGKIVLKHRKINTLTELLDPPYVRGVDVGTVHTPLGRIGVLICADTFDDAVLSAMADQRPDMVLVPYGWAADPDEWPAHGDHLVKVVEKAALTVGAPVIGVDCVGTIAHGPWAGKTFGGWSVACDAQGVVLARGADRVASVDVFEMGEA
jgi:predicted amidohydrolase